MTRFLRFNAVGVAGFAVQLGVVAFLSRSVSGFDPQQVVVSGFSRTWLHVAITVIAVEAALLHNFIWHERWTWADRPAGVRERFARLVRFQMSNGLVSMVGNVAIVSLCYRLAAAGLDSTIHLLAANAVAVVVCSLVNFAAGDRLVFTRA